MKKLVIYSGGMDSFTLLHMVDRYNAETVALSFDYGQRHKKELLCAEFVCRELEVEHHVINLPKLFGGALAGECDVPEGHYEDASMKKTVVPYRNLVMLSHAASFAAANGIREVFYGAHAGDHAIYPDCRASFLNALNRTLEVGHYTESTVLIRAPFINSTKADILMDYGIPWELDYSQTWTCYNGREKACGKCGSCVERREAFSDAGVIDPMEYE